jgi:general secretion pathway protein G
MRPLSNERRARGFSLVELVVTVAILGLLASIAVPLAQLVEQRNKEAELRTALRTIRTALDEHKRAVTDKKIQASATSAGYPATLDALWQGVPDASKPDASKIYFLRRLPRDPFFPDPRAEAAETWGKRSYASPPDDPVEGDDVFDVYSLSPKTGLNGVPYREW